MTANHGKLNIERCQNIGLAKTNSSSDYITDSGAAGTAIATGVKTYNGAIGVNADTIPSKSVLEYAEENKKSTGLVVTCAITHATPASFYAHDSSRTRHEDIAADLLKTDIEVFFGGGMKYFNQRKDSVDLVKSLKDKGYTIVSTPDSITLVQSEKIAGILYPEHAPKFTDDRGEMLSQSVLKALEVLKNDKDGFFMMIEGSQIDWGGHDNDLQYVINETLDFDRVIGKVLDFAESNGNTLVIITADHETGGLGLTGGDIEKGEVNAKFISDNHTAVMVPVFAFGPGSDNFRGIYENTELFKKMMKAFGFQEK